MDLDHLGLSSPMGLSASPMPGGSGGAGGGGSSGEGIAFQMSKEPPSSSEPMKPSVSVSTHASYSTEDSMGSAVVDDIVAGVSNHRDFPHLTLPVRFFLLKERIFYLFLFVEQTPRSLAAMIFSSTSECSEQDGNGIR